MNNYNGQTNYQQQPNFVPNFSELQNNNQPNRQPNQFQQQNQPLNQQPNQQQKSEEFQREEDKLYHNRTKILNYSALKYRDSWVEPSNES